MAMANFIFDKATGKWSTTSTIVPIPPLEPEVPIVTTTRPMNSAYRRKGNYTNTEEEFIKRANQRSNASTAPNPDDRSWSVVLDEETPLKLSFIIRRIIEGYGKNKFEVKGMPPEWDEIEFKTGNPLVQNGSDWAFFRSICKKYGYQIVREEHGRVFRFFPQADGIDNTVQYRIGVQSYGGRLYDLDFIQKRLDESPMYLIKGGLDIQVTSDTGFVPQIKQFIDDEGQSRVVIKVPDGLSSFLTDNHVLMYDILERDFNANEAGTLTGEQKTFFDAISGKNPTLEDWLRYFHVLPPDYNSNDDVDTGYQIHTYQGWTMGFVTHGNKWATAGEWLVVEGTSSNLYFPFQIQSIEHTFSHKWETTWGLIR